MHLIRNKYLLAILPILFLTLAKAQDNVGIGTTTPHPSALLQVSDSSRGVLISRTDTLAIESYVATLNPNPGIADGLLIFDTIVNTYLYYDELAGKWRELISLVGPRGPQGPQGPTGPRGDTGMKNTWTDTARIPSVMPWDTCGDIHIDLENGLLWKLWCDTLGGTRGPIWRDTVLWDKPVGTLKAPDERVLAFTAHASAAVLESMANDTVLVEMVDIPGLSATVSVEPDEVAYIWVAAHGTASKAISGKDISYAQYDIVFDSDEYYRKDNIQHMVSILPNGPPNNIGLADFTGWYLSAQYILEGDITDPIFCRCGTPAQNSGCSCSYGTKSVNIKVRAGNRYSGSSTTSTLYLADRITKENVGHMNVFVIIRRNPNAQPRNR